MGSHARIVVSILILLGGVLFPLNGWTGELFPGLPVAGAQSDSLWSKEVPDRWVAPDKWQHFLGSLMGTVFLGKWAEENWRWSPERSRSWSVGVNLALGFSKELYDSRQPHNHFCWKDLTADLVGIALGVLLLRF